MSESKPAGRPSLSRRLLAAVKETALIVVIALVIATLIKTFLAQMFVIPSQSMENTLQRSDRVLVVKPMAYQRGDVVVFEDRLNWLPPAPKASPVRLGLEFVGLLPASADQYLIKRLVGLPGDHVVCCDAEGRVSVNGVALDESAYLYRKPDGSTVRPSELTFDVYVPEGRFFVLGDHRNASADSRYHLCDQVAARPKGDNAFPSIDAIQGPAKLLAYPFDRATSFSTPATYGSIPAPEALAGAPPEPRGGGC
jgi:signal peptidase I